MKNAILLAGLVAGSATAAAAGGFSATVVEAAPAAAPVSISATDWTGAYAGLQFGTAEAELGLPDGLPVSSVDIDGRHYGLHAGYLRDFGRFVGGAELSYSALDDFEVAGVEVDDFADVSGNLLRGKLLAGYDAGRVLPYAAVSLARASLEVEGEDGSETGVGFGIGAKFMVTPRFMAGIEWMRDKFEISAGGEDVDVDLDTISLSASYRF